MPIGMKVSLGVDATAYDAICEFTRRAQEQGHTWIEGTEQPHFVEYQTRQIDTYEAADVRGGIFSLYVHRYEKRNRTEYIGSVWTVTAKVEDDFPKETLSPPKITAGFI